MKPRAFVFLGAFLMFEAELMVARRLLPEFGSSASVWTTCLMAYQALLCAGYLYGDRIAARVRERRTWWWVHVAVVVAPVATFPFHFVRLNLPPTLAVLVTLALTVGLSFGVLSTTSLVAQRWEDSRDPYYLYGVSNLGSLVALLAYPLLIEPHVGVRLQFGVWYALYGVYVLLHLACMPRRPPAQAAAPQEVPPASTPAAPEWRARITWLLCAASGTALLTAVTNVLVTFHASVPLLWIIPLTVYLATLILCFGRKPPSQRLVAVVSVAAIAAAVLAFIAGKLELRWLHPSVLVLHCAVLGVGCLICHASFARQRPSEASQLGAYYLCFAVGGWAGTALLTLVLPFAPRALAVPYLDYPIAGAVVLAALFLRDKRSPRAYAIAATAFLLIPGGLTLAVNRARVYGSRTFYGLYQVTDEAGFRWLRHGNTLHGMERLSTPGEPLSYYHRGSPIGRIFERGLAGAHVAVVGLGAGTLAAYGKPGDAFDFYELDAEVAHIANAFYTFLPNAKAAVRVVEGDARLTLGGAPDGAYSLLVVDAFSSDFVPTHLLTREAMELYASKLAPDGLIAFHISNRLFDFRPIVARAGSAAGLEMAIDFAELSVPDLEVGKYPSVWCVLARSREQLQAAGYKPIPRAKGRAWTDDQLNVFEAL